MEDNYSHKDFKTSPSLSVVNIDNHDYYSKFAQAYEVSVNLGQKLQLQLGKYQRLIQGLNRLERRAEAFSDPRPQKEEFKNKKQQRRTADQLLKNHNCPDPSCDRSYGSDSALQCHLKLKHPELHQARKRGR